MSAAERFVLLVAHTGRDASLDAAVTVLDLLEGTAVRPVLTDSEVDDLARIGAGTTAAVLGRDVRIDELELVVVLGGDGTILRAAELVRGSAVPLLGVNLGHVGFLAEAEREDLGDTIRRVIERRWDVEERMTIDVRVRDDHGREVHRDWALNEATVEKASRERMLELVVEIDARPLSAFGADGIVVATPTGSTAYAFSAGGPVVWPDLDAMLVVPLSAHALFARPLVVTPDAVVAVEVLRRTTGSGVLWCDGRRTFGLAPGARVEFRASDVPVRLARLQDGKFTDRLVHKFDLPVAGWRGPDGS